MRPRWWRIKAELIAASIAWLSSHEPQAMGKTTIPPEAAYTIDTWEVVDGLPENSATAMAQTRDGYLVIGTFGGLAQFDGVRFSKFGDPQTPAGRGPGVVNLHLDKAGRLRAEAAAPGRRRVNMLILQTIGPWSNARTSWGRVSHPFVRTERSIRLALVGLLRAARPVALLTGLSVGAAATAATDHASCCSPTGAGRAGALLEAAAVTQAVDGGDPTPAPAPSGDDASSPAPPGMVWIAGGRFTMGSTDPLARPDESPLHEVIVDGFWMDATEVTNAQFRAFVEATGYTTVAERPIDWEELKKQCPEGTPKPPDELLRPGSLVFSPPTHAVDLGDATQWWAWVNGADWRHPDGPASSIEGKDAHPVVQIAYADAVAYAAWAGKRLPTEAEWEFAARGGLNRAINTWGDAPIDPTRANTWQGRFPDSNTAEDGFVRTASVRSYPPNGFGLYDMAGNVWEWCSDLYRTDTYALRARELDPAGAAVNPSGPTQSFDARNPYEPVMRVQRGGSFLCNDSYCASYRPSARMACSPDTGSSHVGFRCVATPDARTAQPSAGIAVGDPSGANP